MSEYMDIERIEEQAALWFSRSRGSDFSAESRAQLQTWLQSHPQHERSFGEMARLWDDFDQVPHPGHRPAVGPLRHRRGWATMAVAASLMLALTLALLWPRQDWETYASLQGEQRELLLEDGSRVTLNTDSRLRVRFEPQARHLQLDQGEGFFQVAADAERPFEVVVANGKVRVVGTEFNLRRRVDGGLSVAVLKGRVAVNAADAPVVMLGSGETLQTDADGHVQQGVRALNEIASWRSGQLLFRNRPLAELVEELSRYRQAPIRLDAGVDPALKVSGRIDTGNPESFLTALPHLLPVRIEQHEDGSVGVYAR